MSNRKLSELPTITTPADDDLIHIVDISDTSDPNAGTAGTDKKITRANLIADAASAHTHVVADVTDITASAAELNLLDGVTSTAAQLDYSSNLTSDIQTQLNSKSSSTHTHTASDISDVTASAAELSFSDGVTSNIQSQITAKADSSHSHTAGHISDVTASASELNLLDGVTATTTELNYTDGVTSAIQTQIDAKSSTSHDHALDDLSNVDASSGVATGKLLKYNGSTWAVSDDSGEANQNAFSNVAVSGQSSVSAETATDTLTLTAGSNVTLTTDGASDSVTIAAADTNATHTGEVTGSSSLTIADDVVDEANLKVNNSPSDDDVLTYSSGAGGLTWVAGGTSATNLSATANGTSLTVESSTGTNVALPQASGTAWGVMSDEDKSKLDGIETAATADMTGAQIKTAYENENDTNAFTNTEQSKLSAIEDNATADQTDEEIEDIVGGMVTGNTESGITVTYQDDDGTLDFTVASQTDENFTTADHSKLDGIESLADITDTTNVTAAGALMDSECASLASVKAVTGTNTGDEVAASETVAGVVELATTAEAIAGTDTERAVTPAGIGALLDGAPGALNTLNELAAAIGDDASYAATVTTALGLKAPKASPTFTGTVAIPNISDLESAVTANTAKVTADTTNVTAAGALMDSELTDLAGVKGVTISTLQPKPSEGAFADGDKTKLDAIEASATADQTGAQIKTAYEAESDTNAFTDADHTKLDGIETAATADQTDAEIRTAVGAATDSNVFTDADHTKLDGIAASANNYAISSDLLDEDNMASDSATKVPSQQSVKAYVDSSSSSTNLTNSASGTALTVESSSGSNTDLPAATTSAWGVMTDEMFDKLDAIESSADVTDATNVTAAGALMDSEVTNLADVKAFDTTDYATAAQGTTADAALAASAVSTFGGTLIDDANAAAARTTLGVDASGTDNSTAVTLANTNYLSLSSQEITGGTVPIGSGGTGLTAVGTAKQILGTNSAANAIEWQTLPAEIGLACTDESTAIDSSGYQVAALVPRNMKVTSIKVSLTGEDTIGIDVNVYDCGSDPTANGTAMLSSDLTVSGYSATGTGFSVSELHENDHIRVKVEDAGDMEATGLKVWLLGYWN
jgi:hypothetical protein